MEEEKDNVKVDQRVCQVSVAVRVKPTPSQTPTTLIENNTLILNNPSTVQLDQLGIARYKQQNNYNFDYLFDQQATQQEVYSACMPTLVEMVLKGVNATVFAYGITGSGKTYTMMGPPKKSKYGLI